MTDDILANAILGAIIGFCILMAQRAWAGKQMFPSTIGGSPKAQSLVAVSLAVLLFIFTFVWPTIWQYDHITKGSNTYPIRTNRITGETEVFDFGGWIKSRCYTSQNCN